MTAPPAPDPARWSAVHDEQRADRSLVFRRSAALAWQRGACLARAGERWLDLGCATGQLTGRLAANGAAAVGLDRDLAMLRFARARLAARAVLLAGDAEALPFERESFDGVVAVSLAGCLRALDVLAEPHRVLKRGGLAVLTFTNGQSLLWRIPGVGGAPSEPRQPYRLFRGAVVERALHAHGFAPLELRYYNFFPTLGERLPCPPRIAIALDALGRCPGKRFLARNFLVVARKR